jgi:preprotein translocase subunit SecD
VILGAAAALFGSPSAAGAAQFSIHEVVDCADPAALVVDDVHGGSRCVARDPIVAGEMVERLRWRMDGVIPVLVWRLSDVGSRRLSAFTATHVGGYVGTVLDGKLLGGPATSTSLRAAMAALCTWIA